MNNKPTIAELEAILDEKDVKVEILPNGEVRVAESHLTPGCIDMFFQSGDRQAEIDWDTRVRTECSYAKGTTERHWWTRGYSYKWRILRALKAESALQGMLDWYEDGNGAGFCECDKSVDLTCRACVARACLPTAEAA